MQTLPFARLAPLLVSVALLCGSGCTWYSMTPKERPGRGPANAPRTLNTLVLGEPREAVLTNMHNDLDYATVAAETPDHIQPAFDGMQLDFDLS